MRGEEFDAGSIELVLNVLKKIRHYEGHVVGIFYVGVNLIAHIVVIELSLKHKWSWMFEDSFSVQRSINEKSMHLAPWHIIAHCKDCVNYESMIAC